MSRLTEKHNDYYISKATCTDDLKIKLGQYEDIEDELGIDLLTLFKALKNGIYSKQYGHLFVEHFVLKHDKELHCRPTYCAEIRFALKDYGKTWWLEKPKENDND